METGFREYVVVNKIKIPSKTSMDGVIKKVVVQINVDEECQCRRAL